MEQEWDEPGDADAAPVYPAAPIPLHERSWRHPSELGATSAFVPPPATPELHRGILIVTSLVGLACVIGLALVLLPGDPPTDPVAAGAGSTALTGTVATTTLAIAARTGSWVGIDCDERADRVIVLAVTDGSPADSSGFHTGDVIVAIGGAPIDDANTLAHAAEGTPDGGRLDVTIERSGAQHQLTLWRNDS